MSLEDSIKESLKKFLIEECCVDATEVISWNDTTRSGGSCETCYYEEIVVEIIYIDSNSHSREYTWYGSFGELIGYLA